jgi:two-component system chemotaxis response regulator CheB
MISTVVIGASEGGLDPLRRIVAALPVPCSVSIFIVVHIGPYRSVLPSLLKRPGFPAVFGRDGAVIQAGHIYVAPPDHHMLLEDGQIRLNQGPKIHHTRPAIDPLFMSAAEAYGQQVMGIVLSGGDGDGAIGLRAITEHGGTTLVQRPRDAFKSGMPNKALMMDTPEVLSIEEITSRVHTLCSGGKAKS